MPRLRTTQDVVTYVETLAELHRLAGENVFKTRAFERAAEALASIPNDELQQRVAAKTLTEIAGIGKGISAVLTEWWDAGTSTVEKELRAKIPKGLPELVQLPGLGPKKALALIEALDLHSIAELEYACRENRLRDLKGFGQKAQDKILAAIAHAKSHAHQKRWADVEPWVVEFLRANPGYEVTGAFRRGLEVLDRIEFVGDAVGVTGAPLPVTFHAASKKDRGLVLARTTATDEHWTAIEKKCGQGLKAAADEMEFYRANGLQWIPPECRESAWLGPLKNDALVELADVRGVFHNHTTRSDGSHSAEEMVQSAIALGYRYFGITDHSQSAFYARGLKKDELRAQEKEIRGLQDKYPEIRILWGIESDILADGALDYDDAALRKFDVVIGSIHSRFQMDRDQMTTRLMNAIRHPAIRILGHPTGRLLLGRAGFLFDEEKVYAEAARLGVAIEINANPERMDVDWRKGDLLREVGAEVAISPDAHRREAISDTRFGVMVARKARIPKSRVVNTKNVRELDAWLMRR